jgi:acetolactate synthase-1/2/3 large subunit
VADSLVRHNVPFLFTLCGGHISPILVAAKNRGLRVIDTRHEATAVFAADAVARLTGRPGVAAVTAGPGVTNTITAVKNAQMAQSPLVLLGGATATMLKGRGALQDIDQMALMRPVVKWATSVGRVAQIGPALEQAFRRASEGVPGPVFVELPVDTLYPPELVRRWYAEAGGRGRSLSGRLTRWYLTRHVNRLFHGAPGPFMKVSPEPAQVVSGGPGALRPAAGLLGRAERPLLLIGSQAMVDAERAGDLQTAVRRLGIPTFLSGMARGLLGREDSLALRHRRREALKEADLVILAGAPADFRLNYGRGFNRAARLIAVNRSRTELRRNIRPDLALRADAGAFLRAWAEADFRGRGGGRWANWLSELRRRDEERDEEIARQAEVELDYVNPIALCRDIEATAGDDSIFVGDGGDFVATAAYVIRPRRPLCWLDPGVFGTLGAGAGFALGASLARPTAEIWLLYGDGSLGYSLAEMDTFFRHGVGVVAVVGNDGGWAQIAREQTPLFGDAVGTELGRAAYQAAAEGLGAVGLLIAEGPDAPAALLQAQAIARGGRPALLNAFISRSDFRQGSISL